MNITTRRYPRTTHGLWPCNATEAVALHKYTQPLLQRFFYATFRPSGLAVLLAALALFALAGCDRAAAMAGQEADSRRDVAAQAMCGPGAVVQWLDASTAECIKEASHAARP